MIKLNGVEIKLDKYPDGTFLFKDIPPIGGWCRDNIEWFFESMEELTAVEYITRYCWDHRVVPNLYMPYIPDARMDRVKHKNELFTLKYFAQTINSLHFGKVEVLDPHSDVSAALFNKVHVESPNRMIEDAVKKIASNNLMMFYPDAGAMKRYSSAVHLPYAFGIKNRDWETGEIKGLDLSGEIDQLPGKDILIVDDICSRGGTFYYSVKKLKEAGAFDFDDLIYQTVQLLAEHPDVREFYQNKYRYLLVDEYQDTSVAQFRLVSLLTGPERNICVVGDDDQSIYRFRGATIENILNFEKLYPGTKTIRLEQNYRSTSNILNAANCVIQHNTERKGKTLWTDNGEGDKVQVYTAENEQDEASHIADIIGQHLKEGGHLADHAILYRMNAQSAPIESYFTRAGIPHKIVGGQRFNDRKEVKDIHSYMSIVANPRDDVRLRRIINEPARKIGATTVDVIADLAGQQGVSMLDIISHADQYAKLSRAVMPLLKFWQIYQRLQDSLATRTLDEFASDVIELTGYKAMLEADAAKGHEDAADRLQNLGQLVNNVKNYCDQHGEEATLEGYLEDIALISDIDSYNESSDQVVLMTIHSAKGLEFPYVFLIGMEEGVFPSEMSKYSEADLEEERRLAYVGITRAKKELYISNSVTRMLYGRTQRNEPSRFLREIEPEYIEETRSPVLEQRSHMGGWGSEYSDTVPGGASGYSGPSGYSRSSYGGGYGSSYSSGNRSGYLNREYNAGESRGFGSSYGGRNPASSGFGSHYGNSSTQPTTRSSGFGSAYSGGNATKNTVKQTAFTVNSAVKPAASGSKHYEPGDIVEHKVFGRGTVLKVKPAAGDQIVEINFEKVGIKKTMANFAPLTKITEEE